MQQAACILLQNWIIGDTHHHLGYLHCWQRCSQSSEQITCSFCHLHTRETAWRLTSQWKVSSKIIIDKKICWIPLLKLEVAPLQHSSRISYPISLHSYRQYRNEIADPKTAQRNNLPVIPTHYIHPPPKCKNPQAELLVNTAGTGHWPASSENRERKQNVLCSMSRDYPYIARPQPTPTKDEYNSPPLNRHLSGWVNNRLYWISTKNHSQLVEVKEEANYMNEIQTPLKCDSFDLAVRF